MKIFKLMSIITILGMLVACHKNPASDESAREKSVKLMGNGHQCSGEQIIAPSGATYILTAAHCKVLAIDGSIEVITEDNKSIIRKVIAEDKESDLLLLEGVPNLDGLQIAKRSYRFQHVRTFTHGHGLDTYKTEGVLIQKRPSMIPIELVMNQAEADACTSMKKNRLFSQDSVFGQVYVCVLIADEVYTTALVQPGSSGGMVVDDEGKLVGVVSAHDEAYGMLVDQNDINRFLAGY